MKTQLLTYHLSPHFTTRKSLEGLPLGSLTTTELCASEAKKGEIVIYSSASRISEPVYQSQSVVCKTVNIPHYIETFTSALREKSEMQRFKSFSVASNEERIATPDFGN
ncbi:hypothetical protein AVEN_84726-1 [Araneus ventricosus]|uniref:Uncharacterized protein n=1 Tax=Araneus ventricosus TaxID=182803 RepID=A0A4Y2K217_ARAVE|nr:hypothetical protein AVEN_84726-1 [Araneus ventricosus]